ncbi:hypothetical protein CDL15_Pgr008400 [Punica granatum]|uniref:Uncharacterized protein n=1 Tax=Punica granatum TaxID=22663 RepID=A0A218WNM7_PUNGR|nr:hypothetical protein CDL15_Pgr008400 [Punica granatum]
MTLCLWLRWTWPPYSGWLFVAAVLQAIRSASLAMIPKTILWTSFSKDARYARSRSISSIGLTVGVGSTRGGGASVGVDSDLLALRESPKCWDHWPSASYEFHKWRGC